MFDSLFDLMFDSLFYLLFLNIAGQSAINAFFCNTANPVRSSRVQNYNNNCKYAKNRVKYRATASKISTFYVLHDTIIVLCIINNIAGDADALRGPHKSVDVAGCSKRGESLWHEQNSLSSCIVNNTIWHQLYYSLSPSFGGVGEVFFFMWLGESLSRWMTYRLIAY